MARGTSGRIVVEIDPEMKSRLYVALSITGKTLKDWFLEEAEKFCEESTQPTLFEFRKTNSKSVEFSKE
jgi:hypothetical protein